MHKESGENIACNALKLFVKVTDGTVNFGGDLVCPVFMFCVDRTQTPTEFPLLGQTAAPCGKQGLLLGSGISGYGRTVTGITAICSCALG